MTVHALPFSTGGQTQNDVITFRNWMSGIVPTPGVVGYADLTVAQNGTPNMTVLVAAGQAAVASRTAGQGTYAFWNSASQSVAITAANTNPRIDLICARVVDQDNDGTGGYAGTLVAITGTPAASNPAVPTLPTDASYLPLAQVAVGANVVSITNANITDVRPFASALRSGRVPFAFYGTGANYTTAGAQTVIPAGTIHAPFGAGVPFRVWAQTSVLLSGVTNGDVWDISMQSPALANPPVATDRVSGNGTVAHGITMLVPILSTTGADVTISAGVTRLSGTGTTYSTASDTRFLAITGWSEPL